MERMPEPGDLITAFAPLPGRCFRMVYSHQLQAGPLPPDAGVEGRLARPHGTQLVRGGVSTARAEAEQSAVGGLLSARR